MGAHKNSPVGVESSHPTGYCQSADPGAVGAFRPWIDTTTPGTWLFKVRKADNSGWETIGAIVAAPVSSVFGRTGAVVAAEGDYTLTQLSGVTITAPATGDFVRFDGASWINVPLVAGDIPAHNHSGTQITSGLIDAARIGTGGAGGGMKFLADDQTFKTVVAAASFALTTKTANYTATTSDHTILCNATGGGFTITLPAAAGATNLLLVVKKIDSSANAVTVDGNGSETIDGALTLAILNQYESYTIQCDGTAWHIL